MGLFDFLHGGHVESEAEAYMRQRNKEYARKAAEYRRKEALSQLTDRVHSDMTSTLKQYARKENGSPVETFGATFGAAAGSLIREFNKALNQSNGTAHSSTNNHASAPSTSRPQTKITITTKSTSNVARQTNMCNTCDTTPSIYDGKEESLFVVESASARPALRSVFVVGTIERGGFEIGDKVQIVTPLETRDAIIGNIIRENKSLEYANVSSGRITLAFANCADLMIRKGNTVVKQKKSYFKR